MSSNYWEDLYQKGETNWDKGEASPGLVDFLAAGEANVKPPGTVLVPGCGTGHDVRAWARAGFQTTGFDMAPKAIELSKARTAAQKVTASFRVGDFLRDEPFECFDYLFEHTLFCAIQPSERDAYVTAARKWLKPGGTFVAVFYMIPDEEGPPFGTTREELSRRFGKAFELKKEWVPRSYPNRTNLEWMTIWQPSM